MAKGRPTLALVISAVGVYGVLSYTVRQRTREIGLRVALGAGRSDVMRMVMWQGLSIALPGVVIGALASAGLMRFLSSIVYGVEALDGLTFSVVGVVMLGAAPDRLRRVFPATPDPLAGMTTLEAVLGRRPSFEQSVRALADGFREVHALTLSPGGLAAEELERAESLVRDKYGTERWTRSGRAPMVATAIG